MSVSGSGITVTMGALSAADLMKQADKHRADFERKFGAKGSIISIG